MVEDQSVNADNTAGSGETRITAPDLPTAHLVPPPPPRPSPADFARFTRPSFAQTAFIQSQLPDMELPAAEEQPAEPSAEVEQTAANQDQTVVEATQQYAETGHSLVQAPVYGEPAQYSAVAGPAGQERVAVDHGTFDETVQQPVQESQQEPVEESVEESAVQESAVDEQVAQEAVSLPAQETVAFAEPVLEHEVAREYGYLEQPAQEAERQAVLQPPVVEQVVAADLEHEQVVPREEQVVQGELTPQHAEQVPPQPESLLERPLADELVQELLQVELVQDQYVAELVEPHLVSVEPALVSVEPALVSVPPAASAVVEPTPALMANPVQAPIAQMNETPIPTPAPMPAAAPSLQESPRMTPQASNQSIPQGPGHGGQPEQGSSQASGEGSSYTAPQLGEQSGQPGNPAGDHSLSQPPSQQIDHAATEPTFVPQVAQAQQPPQQTQDNQHSPQNQSASQDQQAQHNQQAPPNQNQPTHQAQQSHQAQQVQQSHQHQVPQQSQQPPVAPQSQPAPQAQGVTLDDAWARVLGGLPSNQRAWLTNSRPVTLHESTAIVAVPDDFTRGQLETRLRPDLERILSESFGRDIRIAVTVDPSLDPELREPTPAPAPIHSPLGGHATGIAGYGDPNVGIGQQGGQMYQQPQNQFGHPNQQNQNQQPQQHNQPPVPVGPPPSADTEQPTLNSSIGQLNQPMYQQPQNYQQPQQHPGQTGQPHQQGQQQHGQPNQQGQQGGQHLTQPTSQVQPAQVQPQHNQNQQPAPAPTPDQVEARLNPKYTFETFVIGSSNRFAHAAAVAVAEAPGKAYNPQLIYGDSGLGKTHLLHAIGHYVRSLYTGARVRYVSSEEFTNDFINAIRDDKAAQFQRRYRDVDVLLIDDIQFLEGKIQTQEEFFHTFNTLHNANKQIVISSDRAPKRLEALEDRLRNRFEWGLITDIQPPDLETRIAILRKKAATERLTAPPEVLEFIASKVQTNIRELEGALIRVTAFASLNRQPVDLSLAEIVLKDLIPEGSKPEVTASMIMGQTASYFGLSIDDLCGGSRSRVLVTARQIAMYLCRELTDLSLPKIGQQFGGRDHTTVMHAERKIRQLMSERRSVFNQVTELTNRIKHQAKQQ